MAIYRVGAGHSGVIPPGPQRVPVPLRHQRQIHQVAGSNPWGQDEQAICSEVYLVHHLQAWGLEQNHH
jgi:hypothetical protein